MFRKGYLDILQLDFEVPLMMEVLIGEIDGMIEVTSLTQDFDGGFNVKMHLTLTGLS